MATTEPLHGFMKGLPPGTPPLPLSAVGQRGWNVLREDLPLPLAILKHDAIEHNSRWMRRFSELSAQPVLSAW
jgi:D-serine dehydratase